MIYICLLASERSERDTLRSVQFRIVDIIIYIYNKKKHLLVNEKKRCRDG